MNEREEAEAAVRHAERAVGDAQAKLAITETVLDNARLRLQRISALHDMVDAYDDGDDARAAAAAARVRRGRGEE